MKLFTKAIDKQLFEQYKYGSDLSRQKVVAKIFNPYGRGVWYLLNSDPADPDYIWAIVDLFSVKIGSVSRSELETVRVPPFRLPLERDMSFDPIPADLLYAGVMSGKRYEEGGLFESDEDDDEDDDEGREDGDNARMLQNQVKSIIHHAKELSEITDDIDKVEPWVITKAQRAATDLADITHYLDGSKGKYARGGQLELFPPEMDDFNAWWEPKGSKPLSEYVYDNPVVKILIGPEGKEQFGVSYTSAEDAWAYIRSYMRGFWDEPSRFAIKVPGEVLKIVKKTVMEDGGIMAKGGVMYPSLSDMPTNVVNEPTEKEKKRGVLEKNVPEIDIKLTKNEKLTNIQIRSSGEAERAFRRIWDVDSMNVRESMYVLYLNQANRIIGYSEHSIGGITGTVLDIQIVAATAAKSLAKGVIVSHNHPSGNLLPSSADIQISNQLKQALKLLNIQLVDSMILVPVQGYTSLVDEGRLADGGMMARGGKLGGIGYIVAYVLKHKDKPDTFMDRYMVFLTSEGKSRKDAKEFFDQMLEQDGDEEGYYLYSINLANILESSDYSMADGGMMARGGKLGGIGYIVAYMLKHKDEPDTFIDRYMVFLTSEGESRKDAKEFYDQMLEQDGDEEGYYLYSINLANILESSDYSMARGGKLEKNYRDELEGMTDEELAKEVSNEIGIDADSVLENIDDDRDDLIDELMFRFKQNMRSRGEMADGGMMAKGGKTDFNTLAEKIAASYEGKKVKSAYQHKYGKRYDKEEAMQVGRATAAVIERRKGRM